MDSRLWSRVVVEKQIACTVAGRRDTVFLYDLSPGGCMIEVGLAAPGAVGDEVTVELGDFETAKGDVVWRTDTCIGVRFDAPIHDAIVRHLGFIPNVATFADQLPRDRFGRTLPPLGAGERR